MVFCSSAAILFLCTQPKAVSSSPIPEATTLSQTTLRAQSPSNLSEEDIINPIILETVHPITTSEEDTGNQIILETVHPITTSEEDVGDPIIVETVPQSATSQEDTVILETESAAATPRTTENKTTLDTDDLTIEELSSALPPLGIPSIYLPSPEEISKDTRLVLKLSERKVYVYQGNKEQASYPVAIGKSNTPTPTGTFEVFQMIVDPIWESPWTGEVFPPGPNSALGLRWIGFAKLPNGIIGFHGTPTISSIGQAASNGCVRMHNEHVVELFEKVKMGTSVTVEP
ncbi:MAG: L,D-transpeptidase [Symploca sp. SIO2C1]|nr:L,D-transpeptidase [Symploca sp. SIO2C1]